MRWRTLHRPTKGQGHVMYHHSGMASSHRLDDQPLSADEIAGRRDAAIHRALNTPPKPNSDYVGTGERARASKSPSGDFMKDCRVF
jgi:hypothetical protein